MHTLNGACHWGMRQRVLAKCLRLLSGARLIILACFLGMVISATVAAAESQKPNILFLFADDQRADTVGALGNKVIKTPTLDGLVKRGFVFHNAYCLGSNEPAVCAPSRNMLLSGRAFFRWTGRMAPPDQPNFPTSFRTAGYQTYHHGKKGNTALLIQEKFEINKYLVDDEAERRNGEPGKIIVDDAIAFLNQRDSKRPFCMYLAFGNPHDPRVAAQKYLDLYDRNQIPLPRNFLPLHPFNNGEQTVRDEQLAPWPRTAEEIRKQLHEYYAVITAFDGHLGRLVETLRQQGLLENTIIVFSADHGLAMGSHGLMGKQSLYEDSMKPPLIFAGPGIPQGNSDALCYLLDLFPTFCELSGTPVPAGLDGLSLKPIITGQVKSVRSSLSCAYRNVQRSIRDERWKVIRYPQINKTQLFDLQTDPDEMNNLADDPAQAERVAGLLTRLSAWQQSFGDQQPLTVEKPQPQEWTPPRSAK